MCGNRLFSVVAVAEAGNCLFHEGSYLLEYNAVLSDESHPTFLRNMLSPSSGSKDKPNKKSAASRTLLASFHYSTLKLAATYSSETSVDSQRTTQWTLHNHRYENLKSGMFISLFCILRKN
jgi:hypothetical protein